MRLAAGLMLAVALMAPARLAGADPASRLREAEAALAAATEPRARLAALGAAAAAHEAVLGALRASLRAIHIRRSTLQTRIGPADGARLAALAALDRAIRAPRPAWIVHPGGPLAAARGTLLLGDLAARHTEATAALGADLAGLDALGRAQDEALAFAAQALAGIERTRRAAILASPPQGARTAPPEAAIAAAAEDVATLVAVLDGIAALPQPAPGALPDFTAMRGALPLPALGDVAETGAGERLVLTVSAWAGVRSPALATVRHVGALGLRGMVVVLEPAPGYLLVLHGLGSVTVGPGQIVDPGALLGTLGGPPPSSEELLIDATVSGGALPEVRLYIELWHDGRPLQAAAWFPDDR